MGTFSVDVWLNLLSYVNALAAFGFFVIANKGIVVGDKAAHMPGLHLPQLFYYSMFSFFFTWPHFISRLKEFIILAIKRKVLIACLLIALAVVVHYNTMVHPYLLADNRHYTFYIWNRSYGRYWWVRYLMVFCYLFFLYCLCCAMCFKDDLSFVMIYVPCTILALSLHNMVEIRYFLVPYIILRLNMKEASYRQLLAEFVFHCVINYLTLNVFFTKNIYWVDYAHPQKLIW